MSWFGLLSLGNCRYEVLLQVLWLLWQLAYGTLWLCWVNYCILMVSLVARGWHFLVLCWPLLVSVVKLCTSQGLLVWCQVLDLDLQFRMLPNVHLVLDFCASELPPNRLMKGWTQLGKNARLLLLMIEHGSSHLRQQFPTGHFWRILLDNFMSYFLQFWRVWKALPFPTLTVLFHKFLPRWDLGLNVTVTTTIHLT